MTYIIDYQHINCFSAVSWFLKSLEITLKTGCKRFTQMKRYRFIKVKRWAPLKTLKINTLKYSLKRIYNAFEMGNQVNLKQKQAN